MPLPLTRRFGSRPGARWMGGFLLLLATLPTGCAYYNTFYLARKHYNQALVEEQKNTSGRISPSASAAYAKAIEQCSKVLQRYRDSKWADDAMLLMGKSYYGQGTYGESRKWLNQMIGLHPTSPLVPEAQVWVGRSYLLEENYESAAQILRETLATYPEFEGRGEALFFVAETDLGQENWEAAIAGYRELIQRYPKSERLAEGYLKVGDAQYGLRRYDEARQSYEMAASRARDPRQRMQSLLRVGICLEKEDRFDEAMKLYDQLSAELVPGEKLNTILSGFDAVVPVLPQSTTGGGQTLADERQLIEQNKFVDENGVEGMRHPAFANRVPGGNSSNDPNADPDNPAPPPDPRRTGEGNATARAAASLATSGNSLAADLPLVLLRHGNALLAMGQYDRAIRTFEAVLAAYPRTSEAAEAQYRIGYAQEVYLEDYAAARVSYDAVRLHGQSLFSEQATRRSGGLARLVALAAADTARVTAGSTSLEQEAEKQFLAAELSWFQQEKAEKAIEQYALVETNFPGTSFAPKAALARAWLLGFAMEDTTAGREALEAVLTTYSGTEQARMAHQILYGEVLVTMVRPDSLTIAAFEDSLRRMEALADSQAALAAREQAEERGDESVVPSGGEAGEAAASATDVVLGSIDATHGSTNAAPGSIGETPGSTNLAPGSIDAAPAVAAVTPALAAVTPAATWARAAPPLSPADSLARHNEREAARLVAENEARAMALAARTLEDSVAAATMPAASGNAPAASGMVADASGTPVPDRPPSRLASENATGLPRPFTQKKPVRAPSARAPRPRPATVPASAPTPADSTGTRGNGNGGRQPEGRWR